MKVTKRDGRSEELIMEKIVVSIVKSGAPVEVAREIAKKVEGRIQEGMSTREIMRMVFEELRVKNPEWEKNWVTYDKAVKKREE